MTLNILDRLEKIREANHLNKSQFEKVLGKSTGYINTLRKNGSVPGTDVLIKISDNYPDINFNWLLKGEGEMKKDEEKSGMIAKEDPGDAYGLKDLQTVHRDLKGDLNELAVGMVKNFKVIADGLQTSMQRQEKIVDFVEKLDADKIAEATGNLEAFLKSK